MSNAPILNVFHILQLLTSHGFFYNIITRTAKHHVICMADLIRPSAATTARASLRSATSGSVAVPRTTSSLNDRSFAVAAPRAWNKPSLQLRQVDSVNIVKRQLKTFLLPRLFSFVIFRFCILLGALVVFRALSSP